MTRPKNASLLSNDILYKEVMGRIMTKYEWERELKRNLHRLPEAEQDRIFDYYTELFMDKIDNGETEQGIIREFGNPFDVANRILSDYDEEQLAPIVPAPPPDKNRQKTRSVPPPPNAYAAPMPPPDAWAAPYPADGPAYAARPDPAKRPGRRFNGVKSVLLFIPMLLVGILVFGLGIGLFAAAIAMAAASVGLVVGGVVSVVFSLFTMGTAVTVGLAQLAAGVAIAGLGLLLLPFCLKGSKALGKWTFKSLRVFTVHTFTSKKKAEELKI